MADESKNLKVKLLGIPFSGFLRRGKPGIPRDGDGDGMFTPVGSTEDNMPYPAVVNTVVNFLRKKTPSYKKDLARRRNRVKEIIADARKGGFTRDRNIEGDVKTGISVGLNRHGLSRDVSDVWDKDGNPKEEAIQTVLAWMQYHGDKVFGNPLPGARERGIGGWVQTVDGVPRFFLDVVDIYPTTDENIAKAASLGKAQNQKEVAILDKVWEAKEADARKEPSDWNAPFIDSGGDGADVIDWEFFNDARGVFAEPKRTISRIFRPNQSGKSEDLSFRFVITEDSSNG
jgi:hypothetical protein